jgi:midasin (ATPase involved in ribosome maturation)
LGGFKPVDIKYIMRPLYELFLSTFKSLYNVEKNQKFLDTMHKCYSENKMKDFILCIKHGLQYIAQKEQEF